MIRPIRSVQSVRVTTTLRAGASLTYERVDRMARFTTSKLRQDIYRILDRVLETGIPVEIERRGRLLRIEPVEASGKLANLKRRDYLVGNPEDIVQIDWSNERRP